MHLGLETNKRDTGQELLVEYCGHQHALGVAAFADDLIRIEAAKDLQILTERTAASTASLEAFLVPRNSDKGETLLSFAGKGVYGAAREAHSGPWRGYPPKLVVKYLGARLQFNGSMQAEINRRIASAKAGFAKYALLFKRSHVPIAHKALVFKAVVNVALLYAFEVRPLGRGDEEALERARGVLLRHIFGRQGYGAVAGDPVHNSVSLESLRRRAKLPTVMSELRVRRLLWLRSALLAERDGQVRLELAALFGTCPQLKPTLLLQTGEPAPSAPRFLDLKMIIPAFAGFAAGWKATVLGLSTSTIRGQASWQSSLSDPAANSEQPGNAMADGKHFVQEEPQRHAEELNIIRCNECGAGPWSSRRALRAHQIRKHGYRPALQAPACPICGRQFTTKSAARRHVQHQSCHKPVNNHGHAGAIAGQLIARTHAAAKAQATPLSPVRAQASERSIADFFARRNGWHGLLEGRPSQPNQSAVQTWADSSNQLNEPPALGEAAQGVHSGLQSPSQSSRVGGMVNTHMAVQPGQRHGNRSDVADGAVEAAIAPAGASSSARASVPYSGRCSSQMDSQ